MQFVNPHHQHCTNVTYSLVNQSGLYLQCHVCTVNKLHDLLTAETDWFHNINLPHIAVIGSQPHKTIVLENLVGRKFLPPDPRIVLILTLIAVPNIYSLNHSLENWQRTESEEWVEFFHAPNKQFHDFEEILNEITMQEELGRHRVSLKIYSPKYVGLIRFC